MMLLSQLRDIFDHVIHVRCDVVMKWPVLTYLPSIVATVQLAK